MRNIIFIFTIASIMLMSGLSLSKESLPVIAVVVSADQDAADLNLSSKNLNLIYWRKQLFWPKGLPIKPVNLRSQNPIRLQFSKTVLGTAPNAQIDYWNGQYFNGILPPYSVNSEEAVLRYVSNTKGAIGYVNACALDERVQALLWLTPDGTIGKFQPTSINCN
jgi:ABC-type phosphate transport system substrate-binding protein